MTSTGRCAGSTGVFVAGYTRLIGCRRQPVTQEAFAYLDTHFPTPTAAGAAQVAAAVDGLVEVPGEVARSCAILASQVLAALC
jgi:hypothetical protein